jgi:transposase-like protein
MKRNGTPHNPTLTLSPCQLAALEALLAGKTVTDAAAAAGVDRSTLHAWLKTDFPFQAA